MIDFPYLVLVATWSNRGRGETDMKRQIALGFTGALISGVYLALGACNGHSFKSTEHETGVTKLYSGHHAGEDHDSGENHADGEEKHHDKKTDSKHGEKGHDTEKEHKEASAQPAKTLFPRK